MGSDITHCKMTGPVGFDSQLLHQVTQSSLWQWLHAHDRLDCNKFCKCQQEKVTLQRFLRRTDVVKGKWVQLPTGRLSGTGADWLLRWMSIPSVIPPPVRTSIIRKKVEIKVAQLLTDSIWVASVPVAYEIPNLLDGVRFPGNSPKIISVIWVYLR